MRIETALKQAQNILRNKNFESANLDCEILMSKALDKDRKYIILNPKKKLENHRKEMAKFVKDAICNYLEETKIMTKNA